MKFKYFLPKSLFGRTLLILITPLILVQLVLSYIFFDRHTETILRLLSRTISGDVALILNWVEQENDFTRIKNLAEQHLELSISVDQKQLLEREGLHKNTWLYSFLGEALSQKISHPYYVRMNRNHIQIMVQTSKGLLTVQFLRKRLFSRTTPLVIIWTTISAILFLLIAAIFMRNQIKPIRRLAEAADRFGKGDESVIFKPEGAFEVRKAGFAFQIMKERLKRQLSERLNMLSCISHDLRTPLTRIKLQLALMPNAKETILIKEDASYMQKLIEGFISYTKGTQYEESKSIQLFPFIEKVVYKIKAKQFFITMDCSKEIYISLKPLLFTRCLTNLLFNARCHAQNAKITVLQKKGHLQIFIDDNGPGIPLLEREKVFSPFYRINPSKDTGIGLGLSIARDIIRIHGGHIFLRNSESGGIRVVIHLPC
ncbi:MAG: sensor histidine kinase [Alphaproteobacteria bacterium]